jgi:hypothetical protein
MKMTLSPAPIVPLSGRVVGHAARIGAIGALFWGMTKWVVSYLRFSDITLQQLAHPFIPVAKTGIIGALCGVALFMFFSIVAGILYALVCRHFPGDAWVGVAYGVLGFLLLYGGVAQVMGMHDVVFWRMNAKTWWTEGCVMLLWGTFVGYSIHMYERWNG